MQTPALQFVLTVCCILPIHASKNIVCDALQQVYQTIQSDGRSCCEGTMAYGNIVCDNTDVADMKSTTKLLEYDVSTLKSVNERPFYNHHTAEERIEQIRKGNYGLTFIDKFKRPMGLINVSMKLKTHEFGFCGIINAKSAYDQANARMNQEYMNAFESMQFSSLGFENRFKYKQRDNYNNVNDTELMNWVSSLNVPVAFHLILYSRWSNMDVELSDGEIRAIKAYNSTFLHDITVEENGEYATQDAFLLSLSDIDIYMRYMVHYQIIQSGFDDLVSEYEITNELLPFGDLSELNFTNNALLPNRFEPTDGYLYTRYMNENVTLDEFFEIVAGWIAYAQSLTTKPLYVNEPGVLNDPYSTSTGYEGRRKWYLYYIGKIDEYLLQQNARPIDRIGFQGRARQGSTVFTSTLLDSGYDVLATRMLSPATSDRKLYDNIDAFSRKYPEKELMITEMEVREEHNPDLNDEERIDLFKRQMTTYFSHPAVNKICWWRVEDRLNTMSPLWTPSYTPTDLGNAWINLTQHMWTTEIDTQTTTQGHLLFRGFKGLYAGIAKIDNDTLVEFEFQTNDIIQTATPFQRFVELDYIKTSEFEVAIYETLGLSNFSSRIGSYTTGSTPSYGHITYKTSDPRFDINGDVLVSNELLSNGSYSVEIIGTDETNTSVSSMVTFEIVDKIPLLYEDFNKLFQMSAFATLPVISAVRVEHIMNDEILKVTAGNW